MAPHARAKRGISRAGVATLGVALVGVLVLACNFVALEWTVARVPVHRPSPPTARAARSFNVEEAASGCPPPARCVPGARADECRVYSDGWHCVVGSCDEAPEWAECRPNTTPVHFAFHPARAAVLPCLSLVATFEQGEGVVKAFPGIAQRFVNDPFAFRIINPALLAPTTTHEGRQRLEVFARVTNYLGCAAHSAGPCLKGTTDFASAIVRGHVWLDPRTPEPKNDPQLTLQTPATIVGGDQDRIGSPRMHDAAMELYCDHTVRDVPFFIEGMEDPRAVANPENSDEVLLFVNARDASGWSSRMSVVVVGREGARRTVPLRLSGGVSQGHKEKNWTPFVRGTGVFVEYSIEPHVVLQVDMATGACSPVGITSSPDLVKRYGISATLSGGPASVLLESRSVFVGMAHRILNGAYRNGWRTYEHVLYLFDPDPPFAVRSFSDAFALPFASRRQSNVEGNPWMVQFVSGLVVLGEATSDALVAVSYGEQDCEAVVATAPLDCLLLAASTHPSKAASTIESDAVGQGEGCAFQAFPFMFTNAGAGVEPEPQPSYETWGARWPAVQLEQCKALCCLREGCTAVSFSRNGRCVFQEDPPQALLCGANATTGLTAVRTSGNLLRLSHLCGGS